MEQSTMEDFLRLHLSTLGYRFTAEANIDNANQMHFQIKALDRESDTLRYLVVGDKFSKEVQG